MKLWQMHSYFPAENFEKNSACCKPAFPEMYVEQKPAQDQARLSVMTCV